MEKIQEGRIQAEQTAQERSRTVDVLNNQLRVRSNDIQGLERQIHEEKEKQRVLQKVIKGKDKELSNLTHKIECMIKDMEHIEKVCREKLAEKDSVIQLLHNQAHDKEKSTVTVQMTLQEERRAQDTLKTEMQKVTEVHQKEVSALKAEIQFLNAKINEKETQIVVKDQHLNRCDEKVQATGKEHSVQLQTLSEKFLASQKILEMQLAEANQSVEKLTALNGQKEKDLCLAREQINEKISENTQLLIQREKILGELKAANVKIDELRDKIDTMEEAISSKENGNQELHARINQLQGNVQVHTQQAQCVEDAIAKWKGYAQQSAKHAHDLILRERKRYELFHCFTTWRYKSVLQQVDRLKEKHKCTKGYLQWRHKCSIPNRRVWVYMRWRSWGEILLKKVKLYRQWETLETLLRANGVPHSKWVVPGTVIQARIGIVNRIIRERMLTASASLRPQTLEPPLSRPDSPTGSMKEAKEEILTGIRSEIKALVNNMKQQQNQPPSVTTTTADTHNQHQQQQQPEHATVEEMKKLRGSLDNFWMKVGQVQLPVSPTATTAADPSQQQATNSHREPYPPTISSIPFLGTTGWDRRPGPIVFSDEQPSSPSGGDALAHHNRHTTESVKKTRKTKRHSNKSPSHPKHHSPTTSPQKQSTQHHSHKHKHQQQQQYDSQTSVSEEDDRRSLLYLAPHVHDLSSTQHQFQYERYQDQVAMRLLLQQYSHARSQSQPPISPTTTTQTYQSPHQSHQSYTTTADLHSTTSTTAVSSPTNTTPVDTTGQPQGPVASGSQCSATPVAGVSSPTATTQQQQQSATDQQQQQVVPQNTPPEVQDTGTPSHQPAQDLSVSPTTVTVTPPTPPTNASTGGVATSPNTEGAALHNQNIPTSYPLPPRTDPGDAFTTTQSCLSTILASQKRT
eukprot:TRINITY_DN75185_c0_g1_i1.p1 TRINITY_DN75185_c0_g1~~TRINITY_DN75185_c0_g1_i1.p1  ORF type:complete len:1008 (+),score=145.29 TRINITY_DN75185_c0_g1_i1:294-3026(+)